MPLAGRSHGSLCLPYLADDLTAAVEQLIDHDTLGIYHIVCQAAAAAMTSPKPS